MALRVPAVWIEIVEVGPIRQPLREILRNRSLEVHLDIRSREQHRICTESVVQRRCLRFENALRVLSPESSITRNSNSSFFNP